MREWDLAETADPEPLATARERLQEPWQFSLRDVLVLVLIASIVLAFAVAEPAGFAALGLVVGGFWRLAWVFAQWMTDIRSKSVFAMLLAGVVFAGAIMLAIVLVLEALDPVWPEKPAGAGGSRCHLVPMKRFVTNINELN